MSVFCVFLRKVVPLLRYVVPSNMKIRENVVSSFAGKGNPVLLTLAEKTSIRLKRRTILSKSRTISFAIFLTTTRVKTNGVKATGVKTTGSRNKDFLLYIVFCKKGVSDAGWILWEKLRLINPAISRPLNWETSGGCKHLDYSICAKTIIVHWATKIWSWFFYNF